MRRYSAQLMPPLLEIDDLKVAFRGDDGRVTHAVDGVDLTVERGATLGIVGESGCGKSVTSLAVMGLLPKATADIAGRVRFDGIDLLDLPDRALRDLRGERLAMIFQEPMTSRCCGGCTSRRRSGASTTIRTGCRAACASAP